MPMTAEDVLQVLDTLANANIPAWLDGGWGVDALIGKQTREHDDLDLVIPWNVNNKGSLSPWERSVPGQGPRARGEGDNTIDDEEEDLPHSPHDFVGEG